MFFPLIASLFYGAGYVLYIFQIYSGGSVPNPASWTVWAVLSSLNAFTFWKGVKSAKASLQFFIGSVANFTVWVYALIAGHFSPLDDMGILTLSLSFLALCIWKITGKATYGNLVIGIILIISFTPTIEGVWKNPNLERALPWYLWTMGFFFTTLNGIFRRKEEHEIDWRLMLFVPVTMFFAHGAVAVLSSL